MSNGILSQEEIDALLSGPDETENLTESSADNEITDMEKDALGEIANISMGTAATTLSQLVGKRVEITTPKVDFTAARQVFEEYPVPHVLISVKYKKGIDGSNMLVLSREDGSVIVDLMMGGLGDMRTKDLSEMQISGISEAMNQMMGSAATSMSSMFSSVVDITPPQVFVSEGEDEVSHLINTLDSDELFVRISFRLIVEDIIDSTLLQVIPVNVAKKMAGKLLGQVNNNVEVNETNQPQTPPPPTEKSWEPPIDISLPPMSSQGSLTGQGSFNKGQTNFVQPARFSPLSAGSAAAMPHNLGLIYDVPLQVSVELGKATKTIKEILELGPGSVVELDRLAGEPVDMIVNGKHVAKCEVVVINETFGIRITEIISPSDRIDTLN